MPGARRAPAFGAETNQFAFYACLFLFQQSSFPDKIFIKTLSSGVDFLGWVNFSDHRILRNSTKKRMLKRIRLNCTAETLASYLGLLSHGNAGKVKIRALELYLENDNMKELRPNVL